MSMSIVDRMRAHAGSQPDACAFRFLNDLDYAPQELSFAQLWQEAEAVAIYLSSIAEPGSRIMLFYPPGLAYIQAFYGCLLAGMVAVPLYPPRRNVKTDRIINVAQSCQARIALTTESELPNVQGAWNDQNVAGLELHFHATDHIAPRAGSSFDAPPLAGADVAFLQYTSGSTGIPKGVMVTHANIVANTEHMSLMSGGHHDDIFVNWLPLFHDLGLVTAVLWPVYLGATSVLMAPATFVRDPIVWLKAITRYRGTLCGAPNFAFDLCIDKIAEQDLAGIDLHSWRAAYNAAEPVRADTLDRFNARFAPYGFRSTGFYPCYGMAEATVFISGGEMEALPVMLPVDRNALAAMRVEQVAQDDPVAARIVACGTAHGPHAVRVVDPASCAAMPDGQVGEVWFSGPSVSPGYWELEELSAETFGRTIAGSPDDGHRYLRTGDLGVQVDGQIYLVGRIKDLIILRGRNYYPHDLEATAAAAHQAVRANCVAAFSHEEDGREQLVLVAELEREYFRSAVPEEVIAAIRQAIARAHEVAVDRVVLLRPYKIPMTSSGKIQRRQTRSMLLDGSLETLAESGAASTAAVLAPTGATELALHQAWCQVLGHAQISTDANFFEIGGDSMAAVEVAALVAKDFTALELDPGQLLDYPTIGALARWIDLKLAHEASKAAPQVHMKTISI